jgi:oligopeptide transport system substrate-binding protein
VSNGAYILEDWRLDDRVRLRANPQYWRKEVVRLQRIDALSVNQATTAFNLFYSGKTDLLLDKGSVPVQFMDELKTKPYFQLNPFLATYFYRFNVTRKPLNDPRVRQALTLAIDKNRIVQKITKAGEPVANSFTPPGLEGYAPPGGLTYDPRQAQELLAQAGFPHGRGFPLLSVLYNSTDLNQQIATEIQAMWKEVLGITVTLRNQEWKVYLNTLDQLDYDIARSSWVGDYPDPNTFLDCFVTGRGNNRTGWSNPTYDQLMAQAANTANPVLRLELMKKAETILVERELPIAPLYYFVGVTLYHADQLGGFAPNLIDEHPLRELYWKKP